MKCPVCKYESVVETQIEKDLKSYQCKLCTGNWVELEDYICWDSAKASSLKSEIKEIPQEVKEAKLCCKCNRIMLKFKVSPIVEFSLDRCMTCGGIWFDCLEWESVKSEGLIDKLNLIFTSAWQENIRKEKSIETIELLYKQKFGVAYGKIHTIKSWLNDYEHREDFFAYLNWNVPKKPLTPETGKN